ncbi:conserved hypothetical protein [Burkholderia vietnamiensis]|nr:conserved hypothetical protein [Burkholderia vietnamiensis]
MEIPRCACYRSTALLPAHPGISTWRPSQETVDILLEINNKPSILYNAQRFYTHHYDVSLDLHVEIGISPNSNLHVEIGDGNRMP